MTGNNFGGKIAIIGSGYCSGATRLGSLQNGRCHDGDHSLDYLWSFGWLGRQGCLLDIVVGVVGAFIGGALVELTTGSSFSARFNLTSFIVAVLGAVVLLFLLNVLRRGRV